MRRFTRLFIAVGGSLMLAACGSSSAGSGGGGSDQKGPDKVTVGVIPISDVAAIYVGEKQGFFKDANIDLTMKLAQGGAAIVPAVLSGDEQFGFSNNVSLIIAASKGLPIKLVTPGVASTGQQGKDFQGIAVRGDSPIKTAKDLEGKTVAVNTLKNICGVSINESVRKAGGDPSKVNYVEVAPPDQPDAVSSGRVDAACMGDPFLTPFEKAGGRVVAWNFVDVAPNATIASYFTSKQLAQSNPDLVRRFTAAMKKSLNYADTHRDAVIAAIPTYTDLTKDQVAQTTIPRFPSEFNRASIERMAQLSKQDGLIDKVPDLNQLLP